MKLSNINKYAIQGMLLEDKSIEDIAKQLKLSTVVIENYINNLSTELKNKFLSKDKKAKLSKSKELIVTKTQSGRKGVAVMTQAASERGDSIRNRPKKPNFSGKIFRIDDGKPV